MTTDDEQGGLGTAAGAGRGIVVRALAHRYEGSNGVVEALAGIDLEIDDGSFTCLVGPSGCGKTTLLRMIAGFLRPTTGEIVVHGRHVETPGPDRGVVFQHPTSLYPWLDVRGNVEFGLRLRGAGRAERRRRAETELARVGLSDAAARRIDELSGGMQQRCQIARVLASDPEVMLMDEPFGALDAITREALQEELRTIWRDTGRTVVFITHSVDEAVLLGTRVLVMSPRPGRVVFDEPMPFSTQPFTLADLRSRPDVASAAARVRAAIDRGPIERGPIERGGAFG
jgi:taurine transport system ATP-binding protein